MYRNFHIYKTENNTFIVKADSERFGSQAIVFEHFDIKKAIEWMYNNYRNKEGKVITNMRWTSKLYRVAMSTCDIPDNFWFKRA